MSEEAFDFRSVLALIRRHLRLIFVTICLFLAAAVAALFVLKPVYTASTLVLVDTGRKDLLAPDTQMLAPDNGRVDSEVELVKSDATLLKVVEDTKLTSDPEFGVKLPLQEYILGLLHIQEPEMPTGDEALQSVLINLRNALDVQRRGLTNLIAINVRAHDPQEAAKIANAVAAAYIHDQLQSKVDATLSARDIIQSRINDASAAVASSESAFDNFISSNMDAITAATGRTDLTFMRQQLSAEQADSARMSALADAVAGSAQRRDWKSIADALKSDALKSLLDQRKALSDKLSGLATGSAEEVNLRAELAKVDTSLGAEASTELASLKAQVAASEAKASDLRDQLRTTVLGANLPPNILASLYGLQQNSQIARSQYQTLLARLKDLETQAFLQVADSRIVSPALAPVQPSFPNTRLFLLIASIAGLASGVALAFTYENLVGGFTSEEQMEAVLHVPVLASVLRQKSGELKDDEASSFADLVTQVPLSLYAESIRRIRLGTDQAIRKLLRQPAKGSGAVIMVTSANPAEGKTTTALALARAYALSGKSTVLIDCDLRKPSVHRQAGIQSSGGLLEYLTDPSGKMPLTAITWPDRGSGVQIVVGGRRGDVETDQLITGQAFAHLLGAARGKFEIVILDTPPTGYVVDGLYLAQFANVIIFVTRWASTRQTEAKAAIAALTKAKPPQCEILAVLNQQVVSTGRYRSHYSGYYSQT